MTAVSEGVQNSADHLAWAVPFAIAGFFAVLAIASLVRSALIRHNADVEAERFEQARHVTRPRPLPFDWREKVPVLALPLWQHDGSGWRPMETFR